MAVWRRRSRAKRRRAVAGILAALMLFVMLFTVGTGYFLYVNQNNFLYSKALSNRATSLQNTFAESLSLSTNLGGNGHIQVTVVDTSPRPTTLQGIFVVSPAGAVQYITSGASPALPLSLDAGVTSAPIDTSVAYTSGTYVIKVLTQQGATFSATYPPTATSLAAQALSSGAIGDLYLSFDSFTFYVVSSSNCPSGSGYSNYCLLTSSGNTGPGFALSASTYSFKNIAFSITLTDLNPNQYDIILDQFSLIYQNTFYGFEHQNFVSWNIVSVGTPSGGKIPILNQYSPVVLTYDVPLTVYYVTQNCVTASQGPNDQNGGCDTVSNDGPVQCPCTAGSAATVFILSNGWEYAHGSYQINNLAYSGTNYGQNTPFVSTLYY